MGLSPWLLRAIKRKGFRLPTPIQRRTLPLILQVRAPPRRCCTEAAGAFCFCKQWTAQQAV